MEEFLNINILIGFTWPFIEFIESEHVWIFLCVLPQLIHLGLEFRRRKTDFFGVLTQLKGMKKFGLVLYAPIYFLLPVSFFNSPFFIFFLPSSSFFIPILAFELLRFLFRNTTSPSLRFYLHLRPGEKVNWILYLSMTSSKSKKLVQEMFFLIFLVPFSLIEKSRFKSHFFLLILFFVTDDNPVFCSIYIVFLLLKLVTAGLFVLFPLSMRNLLFNGSLALEEEFLGDTWILLTESFGESVGAGARGFMKGLFGKKDPIKDCQEMAYTLQRMQLENELKAAVEENRSADFTGFEERLKANLKSCDPKERSKVTTDNKSKKSTFSKRKK